MRSLGLAQVDAARCDTRWREENLAASAAMTRHFARPRGRGLAQVVAMVVLMTVPLAHQSSCRAHDIPDSILVQGFVKPEGDRLDLLIRLPLSLLTDIDLPRRGPGYLDLETIDEKLSIAADAAAGQVLLFEQGERLSPTSATTQIAIPSDASFETFEQALTHLHGEALPVSTELFWNQGFFDVHLQYPIRSDDSEFAIDVQIAPGLNQLTTLLSYIPADGNSRVYRLTSDAGRVALDPSWFQSAWRFVVFGFKHILEGMDHLLFLLCLVIPVRDFKRLLVVVTSFTIAHSITLLMAATGFVPEGDWFLPLIETLIAASILYMAIENIFAEAPHWRWMISFGFGLVHGFGFSFALRDTLQLAGSHHLLALFSFNVGVELGQIAALLVMVPALGFASRWVDNRVLTIVLSTLIGHTAWHWMIDRGSQLTQVTWPSPTVAITTVSRVLLVLLLAGGALWIWRHRRQSPASDQQGS